MLLFEHAYASQFGTFLGNSAAERLVQFTVILMGWRNVEFCFIQTSVRLTLCTFLLINLTLSSLFHRGKLSLPEKTVSLWSWVNRPQELERLTNPLYESNSLVIWPSVAPQSLLLWEGKKQIITYYNY